MKTIVITYSIPRPDQSSGERRFVNLLELLAEKHEVDLCVARFGEWLLSKKFRPYIENLEAIGVNVLPIHTNSVKEALSNNRYEAGFFEFYWIAEETIDIFRKLQPQAVTIIDSVDLHYAREETQAKVGLIPANKAAETKKRELRIYREADITIAVSLNDLQILSEKDNIANVLLVPNIVETIERKEISREPVVIFIGAYLWPPNVDAVKWFIKEIWPKVYERNNKAEFLVIGSDPPDEIKEFESKPGVQVLGFVPETKPYLDKAAVSVAPLRYGGGMKGKVNEALAHGIPVVATSIGAQGFEVENGKQMFVEDEPGKFADSVIELLNNPDKQRSMGLAGQKLNESICSPEVVREMINKVMDKAMEIYQQKEIPAAEKKKKRNFLDKIIGIFKPNLK